LVITTYRGFNAPIETALILRRTEYEQSVPVEPDLTPMGLINRLEHIVEHLDHDLREQERRAVEATTHPCRHHQVPTSSQNAGGGIRSWCTSPLSPGAR
jgi:hypothetical protein